MAKVYAFLADGCEEVEVLTTIDLLRRAGNEVVMVSINGQDHVIGSNKIGIMANQKIEDGGLDDGDLYFLPGGMPGTTNLGDCKTLTDLLVKKNSEGVRIAAICAAPSVFGKLGLLQGKKAVCYPGMEGLLTGADVQATPAVTDGNITTGKGVGAAIDFALELIKCLNGQEKAAKVKSDIVYPY